MRNFQHEHKLWVDRKYPGQSPKIPACGCLEEAGELVHAILKIEQVQTWGEDARHKLPELREKLVDAIGDCGIYVCSLCNANGWDFFELWDSTGYVLIEMSALDTSILLCKKAADVALEPTERGRLSWYISYLKAVAFLLGLNTETAVRVTWEKVKCR